MAMVVTVTILLYLRTAWYGFINYDDYNYVVNNPHIREGLTLKSIRWAITTGYFSYWHPITWLGYLTLTTFFGVAPGPMHVANFLLHAANAGLLLYVLWRMTGCAWRSAIVAALFAWHPLRVESVAWISELKDVISAFFWLLTMLLYVRYVERPSLARYAAVSIGYLCGLACKPMLVTLPAALILLDFWPLGRTPWSRRLWQRDGVPPASWKRIVLEKIPLLAMSLVVAYYAIRVQRANYASGGSMAVHLRLQNALVAVATYLGKFLWPHDLAIFYPHPYLVIGDGISMTLTIVAAIVFAGLTVLSLAWARRRPYVLVGWLWFLGTILPVSGAVEQAGQQAMGDRYSYIPLIIITVAIVWMVADWLGSRPRYRPIVASVTAVALIALLVKASIQISYWRDDLTLFSHAVRVTQNNYIARASLGYYYSEHDQPEQAIAQYRLALRARPIDPLSNANMAKFYQARGDLKQAEWYYRRALKYSPPDSDLHNNLANILAGQGKYDEAIEHHEQAIRIGADFAHTHYNYGVTLASIGRLKEAQARLERALQLKPDYPDARYTYGLVMAGLGYEAAATAQLRDANFLRADWYDALRSLAWLLATSPEDRVRDGRQAVMVAERANQITGYENPVALDTLAAAYAEAGRFDNAVATESRAIDLARSAGRTGLADRFASRLALYRQNKPFRRVLGATTQPFES